MAGIPTGPPYGHGPVRPQTVFQPTVGLRLVSKIGKLTLQQYFSAYPELVKGEWRDVPIVALDETTGE